MQCCHFALFWHLTGISLARRRSRLPNKARTPMRSPPSNQTSSILHPTINNPNPNSTQHHLSHLAWPSSSSALCIRLVLGDERPHNAAAFLSIVLVVDTESIGLKELEFAAPMDVEPVFLGGCVGWGGVAGWGVCGEWRFGGGWWLFL
jgi:hypothetical protein